MAEATFPRSSFRFRGTFKRFITAHHVHKADFSPELLARGGTHILSFSQRVQRRWRRKTDR